LKEVEALGQPILKDEQLKGESDKKNIFIRINQEDCFHKNQKLPEVEM
jgi:hypothetical protein